MFPAISLAETSEGTIDSDPRSKNAKKIHGGKITIGASSAKVQTPLDDVVVVLVW